MSKVAARYVCLGCELRFSGEAGPTTCPKCKHVYVRWENFEQFRTKRPPLSAADAARNSWPVPSQVIP